MATRQLSIYLLRQGVSAATIIGRRKAHEIALGAESGQLLLDRPPASEPSWLEWLRSGKTDLPVHRAARVSGLLLLEVEDRAFAIAFGGGSRWLKEEHYVRDFGRDVALRALDPGRLRAVDARAVSTGRLATRRQLSQDGRVGRFDLDPLRDAVSALRGIPQDTGLAARLGGRDAALLSDDLELAELPARCRALLGSLELTAPDAFSFAAAIRPVHRDQQPALRKLLLEHIRNRSVDEIRVAPPEVLPDELSAGFGLGTRASPPGSPTDELTMVEVLKHLDSNDSLSDKQLEGRLRRLRLWAFDETGPQRDWPLMRCMEAEFVEGFTRSIYDDGRWWEVSNEFRQLILDDLAPLRPSGIRLPAWPTGKNEGTYNALAARGLDRKNLDQKSIALDGATQVEPCDVYVSPLRLLHVKRRDSYSKGLSHLFAQAAVSAELLADEKEARDKLRTLLRGRPSLAKDLPATVAASDFTIGLCIAATPGLASKDHLPFFALVNLRDAYRRIRRIGCEVTLDFIEMVGSS